jgi:hypothetical protein
MKQIEKDEKIQQLERELRELKATPHEPGRMRVNFGVEYAYIDPIGGIGVARDERHRVDDIRHALGNYWKFNSGDAENSTLHYMTHSEYEYWLPASSMSKPKAVPEGLQMYNVRSDSWVACNDRIDSWCFCNYRWPKASYKGE